MSSEVQISKRLVLINSASSLAARLLNLTVLVWMYRYLLRRVSPDEYSIYAVILGIMSLTPFVTSILTGGLARYVVEAYAQGDEPRVTRIVSSMFPLLLLASFAVLAAGSCLAVYLDRWMTIGPGHVQEARLMMLMMVCSVALNLAATPFTLGLFIRQRFVLSNMIQIGQDVLRIGLMFILLVGISPRVIWIVVASVCANGIGLLATVAVSRRLAPALRFRLREMRAGLARRVVSFGTWSAVGQLSNFIHDASDPIILNKLATSLDVTVISLGSVVDQQIRSLSSLATMAALPAMTALSAQGDANRLQRAYLQGSRCMMWAALFLAVPAMIFSKELVVLYVGPQYLPAATVLLLLMTSYPFSFGMWLLGNIAYAKAQMAGLTSLLLLFNVINLLLTLYLVGALRMGALGSAIGSATARILIAVSCLPLSRRLTGVPLGQWFKEAFLPGLAPAAVAAAVMLTIRFFAGPTTWLGIGISIAAGSACYVGSLVGWALRPEDRETFPALFERVLGWVPCFKCRPGKASLPI